MTAYQAVWCQTERCRVSLFLYSVLMSDAPPKKELLTLEELSAEVEVLASRTPRPHALRVSDAALYGDGLPISDAIRRIHQIEAVAKRFGMTMLMANSRDLHVRPMDPPRPAPLDTAGAPPITPLASTARAQALIASLIAVRPLLDAELSESCDVIVRSIRQYALGLWAIAPEAWTEPLDTADFVWRWDVGAMASHYSDRGEPDASPSQRAYLALVAAGMWVKVAWMSREKPMEPDSPGSTVWAPVETALAVAGHPAGLGEPLQPMVPADLAWGLGHENKAVREWMIRCASSLKDQVSTTDLQAAALPDNRAAAPSRRRSS